MYDMELERVWILRSSFLEYWTWPIGKDLASGHYYTSPNSVSIDTYTGVLAIL